MSRDTSVIAFRQPDDIDDPLTELAREGARPNVGPGVLAHRGELQGEDTPDQTAGVSGMRRSAVSSCPARAEWWHLAQRPDCQ